MKKALCDRAGQHENLPIVCIVGNDHRFLRDELLQIFGEKAIFEQKLQDNPVILLENLLALD